MNMFSLSFNFLRRAAKHQCMIGSTRTLISKNYLGISDYKTQRSLVDPLDETQIILESEAHKLARNMKYYLHTVERRECIEKFSEMKRDLQIIQSAPRVNKVFTFGPLVMRTLHYLNLSDQALDLHSDENLSMMFDSVVSKMVICDLLFENKRYGEVVDIIKKNAEMQEKKQKKSSYRLDILMFASCYKLNTEELYKHCLQLWKQYPKEKRISQSGIFLSISALNLGHPKDALNTLESFKTGHFVHVFAKLIALAECGQFEKAAKLVEEQKQKVPNFSIFASVISKINEVLTKYPQSEDKTTFLNLLATLPLRETDQTIDEMICHQIDLNGGPVQRRFPTSYKHFTKINKIKSQNSKI